MDQMRDQPGVFTGKGEKQVGRAKSRPSRSMAYHSAKSLSISMVFLPRRCFFSFLERPRRDEQAAATKRKREKRIYKEESNLYCIRDASPVSVMNFACVGVSAAFRCVRRGCANENGKVKEYQGKLIEKKKKKIGSKDTHTFFYVFWNEINASGKRWHISEKN